MSWCVCVRHRGEIESACVHTSVCVGVFVCVLALPLGVYNKRQQAGQTLTALRLLFTPARLDQSPPQILDWSILGWAACRLKSIHFLSNLSNKAFAMRKVFWASKRSHYKVPLLPLQWETDLKRESHFCFFCFYTVRLSRAVNSSSSPHITMTTVSKGVLLKWLYLSFVVFSFQLWPLTLLTIFVQANLSFNSKNMKAVFKNLPICLWLIDHITASNNPMTCMFCWAEILTWS